MRLHEDCQMGSAAQVLRLPGQVGNGVDMFREMRRKGQQITTEECMEILQRATSGVLGVYGDDGYPYTVPLSFVYTPPGPADNRDVTADSAKKGPAEGGASAKSPDSSAGLGTIGFHCAKTGHKIDGIRRNEKVSFTVIDRDEIMPKERTTKFCSVIAFGRARILEGEENLRRAANKVGAKYSAGYEDLYMEETEDTIRRGTLCCVEITIDHMTGKIGKEILKERNLQKHVRAE